MPFQGEKFITSANVLIADPDLGYGMVLRFLYHFRPERGISINPDVRYADIVARRYGQCLSVQDLAVFADVPCRKVVILDTCHSGAIQPLTQRQLKAAIRALQDDMAITVTASEGSQEAVQSRFARRLKQGLDGAADQRAGDANGIVTLTELANYVRRMVTLDSAEDESIQVPIAGPKELLELVEVPLVSVPAGDIRTTRSTPKANGSTTRKLVRVRLLDPH